VLGLLLRLYALGRGPMNSDEAVVGLMAREILHGHFFAFYWGQNYGGPEAYVVAVVFAVSGSSSFTLGLTPVLLCAGSLLLLWRIGNRMFASPVGAVAAIAFWVWPETYMTSSTVEDGFRWLALLCGLTVLLTVLRIGDGKATTIDWIALGLGAGVGWWCTPEIAYFLAPAGVYLLGCIVARRAKVSLVSALLGVAAAIIGSLPWWWHNLSQNFNSFAGPVQPSPPGPGGAYWWHLGIFGRYVVPLVLGLRIRMTGRWIGPTTVTPHLVNIATVVLVAWLAYAAVLGWGAARGRAWLLLLYVAAFPFLYAAQPFSWYWQDGRYAVFLAPAVALTLASLACQVGTWMIRSPRVAPAIMAALVLLGGAALTLRAVKVTLPYVREVSLPTVERSSWFSWHANPNNLPTELAASLIRWHVHDAFTGYWLAYDVTFLAQGSVTVSPAGPVFIRYLPYYDAVAASPAPAWIFVSSAGRLAAGTEAGTVAIDPGCNSPTEPCLGVPEIVRWCVLHHISYQIRDSGPYIVVLPSRRVLPTQILPAFSLG
jgi:4-amino-4-deoxy-L-arabinose transferase-like glycosyltransferase